MRRELRVAIGCAALTAMTLIGEVRAQDAGRAAPPATATATARRAGPIEAGAAMPSGHPVVPAQGDEQDSPHGQDDSHGAADPHAGGTAGGGGAGNPDEAPEDVVREDPSIPRGTVDLHAADPTGKPLGRTEVTLGILYNSVAKGESRKRVTMMTDDAGVARFKDLEIGSGIAYRPMVLRDGATFSVTPFQLGPNSGMSALVHVYPVTSDVDQTLVVTQSMLYVEVKDDRIQIQQAVKLYNFGKNAWVPSDLIIPLPENYTAFATQQGMTDVGIDPIPNKGAKLRGTFGPGQHVVEFKWQLPYAGEGQVKFDVGMAPHLAAARVIAPASKGMGLEVEGFAPPQTTTDGMGQRALVTEKQLRRDEPPVKAVSVTIKGLPTEGPGKVIATLLAFGGILMGVVLGSRKAPPRDTKRERDQLLAALEGLELGHREGTIGPKTYERARRELIDDIARTFAADPAKTAKSAKPGRRKVA